MQPPCRPPSPRWPFLRLACLLTGVCILALTGCHSPAVRNEAVAAAQLGSDVSDKAIALYERLDGLGEKEIQLQNEITLITAKTSVPADELPFVEPNATLDLSSRIAAYKKLKALYAQFSLLASTDFAGKAKTSATALNSAIGSVEGLKSLKGSQLDAGAGLAGLVIEDVQAGDVQKHNLLLQSIVTAFSEAWKADQPILIDRINLIYNSYIEGLGQLTRANLDLKRLREINKEPYRDDILVGLYKLDRRRAMLAERDGLISDIRTVGRALEKLAGVHGELAKKEPSLADVLGTIDRILAEIEKLEN